MTDKEAIALAKYLTAKLHKEEQLYVRVAIQRKAKSNYDKLPADQQARVWQSLVDEKDFDTLALLR